MWLLWSDFIKLLTNPKKSDIMKNNLLKFGLLVLLAVFTFHSCSDDEQVISPKSVDSSTRVKYQEKLHQFH